VEAQRIVASRRTIRLHAPSGEPVPVNADAERIGQVIANYQSNALKYSPPDRPVNVYVEADKGWARVAVRDEGPGLPEDEQARIWEQFHQAPGVTTQGGAVGSLGLGLHICKEIVEVHGGQVGVESALGRGSTFWFTLPLASTASPAT
jgi:signal transduction histidine kinase